VKGIKDRKINEQEQRQADFTAELACRKEGNSTREEKSKKVNQKRVTIIEARQKANARAENIPLTAFGLGDLQLQPGNAMQLLYILC
jgi:hypothetical protein